MKETLKCTCHICCAEFELTADYIIPGVEGCMNLAGGPVTFLDPTRTNRMCDTCREIEIAKLLSEMEAGAHG